MVVAEGWIVALPAVRLEENPGGVEVTEQEEAPADVQRKVVEPPKAIWVESAVMETETGLPEGIQALLFQVVPGAQEDVMFLLSKRVPLLYRYKSLELYGIQTSSFVPELPLNKTVLALGYDEVTADVAAGLVVFQERFI